jgi:hypothetical protein
MIGTARRVLAGMSGEWAEKARRGREGPGKTEGRGGGLGPAGRGRWGGGGTRALTRIESVPFLLLGFFDN